MCVPRTSIPGVRSSLSCGEVLIPSSVNSVTLSVTEEEPIQGPILSSWDGAAECLLASCLLPSTPCPLWS